MIVVLISCGSAKSTISVPDVFTAFADCEQNLILEKFQWDLLDASIIQQLDHPITLFTGLRVYSETMFSHMNNTNRRLLTCNPRHRCLMNIALVDTFPVTTEQDRHDLNALTGYRLPSSVTYVLPVLPKEGKI